LIIESAPLGFAILGYLGVVILYSEYIKRTKLIKPGKQERRLYLRKAH
jgi:hypothetical protein